MSRESADAALGDSPCEARVVRLRRDFLRNECRAADKKSRAGAKGRHKAVVIALAPPEPHAGLVRRKARDLSLIHI